MDNVLRTRLNAPIYQPDLVGQQAKTIASDMGIFKGSERDAFRHAYVWARLRRDYGETISRGIGYTNELFGRNRTEERRADLLNNEKGFKISRRADDFVGLQKQIHPDMPESELDDLWERYVRIQVTEKVKNGELIPNPKGNQILGNDINDQYDKDFKVMKHMGNGFDKTRHIFSELYSKFKSW
ncbi:MAG: hypothetical protein WAZ18_06470 [Alphaproteobacteria bacterium]